MDSFEIAIDDELKFVKIRATGELFQADGEKVISTGRSAAMERGYNLFCDISQATTTVPFSSYYHMPRELPVFQDKRARLVKSAILASPDDKAIKEYKFYELVTANLGFKVRFFFDEKEALEWLAE